jgi:3-oxoacyl-(acyl-carrier-protein) synthase
MSISNQHVPHIKNLKVPCDPDLRYAYKNSDWKIDYMLKSGYVFGGINTSLVFKKYVPPEDRQEE